jgi:hypothetical protein
LVIWAGAAGKALESLCEPEVSWAYAILQMAFTSIIVQMIGLSN